MFQTKQPLLIAKLWADCQSLVCHFYFNCCSCGPSKNKELVWLKEKLRLFQKEKHDVFVYLNEKKFQLNGRQIHPINKKWCSIKFIVGNKTCFIEDWRLIPFLESTQKFPGNLDPILKHINLLYLIMNYWAHFEVI